MLCPGAARAPNWADASTERRRREPVVQRELLPDGDAAEAEIEAAADEGAALWDSTLAGTVTLDGAADEGAADEGAAAAADELGAAAAADEL